MYETMTNRQLETDLDQDLGTYTRATYFAIVSLYQTAEDVVQVSPACVQLVKLAYSCDDLALQNQNQAKEMSRRLAGYAADFELEQSARHLPEVPGQSDFQILVRSREQLAERREAFKAVAKLAFPDGSPILAALGERLRLRAALPKEGK